MSDITAAFTAISTAFSLSKNLHESVVDQAVKEKAIELNNQLFQVQSLMIGVKDQNQLLEQENQQLKKQIIDMNTFKEEIKNYKLVEVSKSLILNQYQKDDDIPSHVICPSCVSDQKISILQVDISDYVCPICQFKISSYGKRTGSVSIC